MMMTMEGTNSTMQERDVENSFHVLPSDVQTWAGVNRKVSLKIMVEDLA